MGSSSVCGGLPGSKPGLRRRRLVCIPSYHSGRNHNVDLCWWICFTNICSRNPRVRTRPIPPRRGLVGGVAIIALIVLTVVKCQLSKPVAQRKPQNDESRVEVGLQPSTDTTAGSEPAKGFELTQVPTEQI